MDFLIPLTLFRVRYETAAGRPYSDFDKLVLEAIAGGAGSLESLHAVFLLRKRMLIEAVVTLARAGWIAIDVASGKFRITPPGNEALQSHAMPVFTVIDHCEGKIVMEAITGNLLGQQEMKPYVTNRQIEQNGLAHIQKLPREFALLRLDPGQAADYLELEQGEWLRWVDMPEIVSRENHWLLISADPESGIVNNLPSRWRGSLEPLLLAKARQAAPQNKSAAKANFNFSGNDEETVSPPTFPELFTEKSLLLSRREHFNVITKALEEAVSSVFIASAFFDTSEIDGQVRALVLAALKRGVQIYFLWGYSVHHGSFSDQAALNWLRDLKKEAGEHGRRLRFNKVATDSHAKFLIYDNAEGFNAFVGSCNWLSSCLALKEDSREPTEVTIRITHPALVASLCRSASGFWKMSNRGIISDAPELLRRAAERLDLAVKRQPETVSSLEAEISHVRIIRDQEHESKMRELLFNAKKRCLVVSNKFGAKAAIRLTPLNNNGNKRCQEICVQYAKMTPSAPKLEEIEPHIRDCIERTPIRHSKLIIADDVAIITSYNFLSADPFGNFANAHEVGILINGGRLPSMLWEIHVRKS